MIGLVSSSAVILGAYLWGKLRPESLLLFTSEATLVLCSVFILLYVGGLRDGIRYAGVVFMLNVIIKAIFS